MATLSGTYMDLATDGVPFPASRNDVVMAVRRIILAAHRAGMDYTQFHALLTDTHNRRLAVQFQTGRGQRQISAHKRTQLLRKLWAELGEYAKTHPVWSRDDALDAIEFIRENWSSTDDLPERERSVLNVVLDLATEHGTTRPTVPVRRVSEQTGIPFQTVSRILNRLAAEGEWLSLVKRGNRHTRRASIYTLAPALLHEFSRNIWGASPPASHPLPMSHPPTSHGDEPMSMSITVTASSAEDLRRAIQALTSGDPEETRRLLVAPDFPRLRLLASGD